MDKITEVELKLDGIHLHPLSKTAKGCIPSCIFKSLLPQQTECGGELVPMIDPNSQGDYWDVGPFYILACKVHADRLEILGNWRIYVDGR
jgi:hypothetical protein